MNQPIPSLQDRLVAAGCTTDHHESDLYVEASDAATDIIRQFQAEGGIVSPERFTCAIDGAAWYDLPFAYYKDAAG